MKILIIDDINQALLDKLHKAGFEYEHDENMPNELVKEKIKDFDGIILRSKILADKDFIDSAPRLKFIGRVGAGMETIDIPYAESKGIRCLNSPEGNRDAVGEQAVGMLLAITNKLLIADSQVRKKIWDREGNRGFEIKGKTVGIIGYGNMGKAFAQRLAGFECTTIAYDKYKSGFSDQYAAECSLEDIFEKSDIISLHVPQTDETIYMGNKLFFESFAKPIIIINTARGKVVELEALANAMKKNKVIGAALDVLEYESYNFENFLKEDMPPAWDYLTQNPKVVFTPHIAGWTVESKVKLSSFLADKIIAEFGQTSTTSSNNTE